MTHSCTSSGQAGSAGELTCLEAAHSVSGLASGAPAGPCPSPSRGSITCKKTLPTLASRPPSAHSHSPPGISWDRFPDKPLALQSSPRSLRLGEPTLRSRCQENQTSRKSRDVLSMQLLPSGHHVSPAPCPMPGATSTVLKEAGQFLPYLEILSRDFPHSQAEHSSLSILSCPGWYGSVAGASSEHPRGTVRSQDCAGGN